MDESFDLLDAVRREAVRAILERAQGEMLKGTPGASEDEGTPEGVVEELDIAYINRDGVPLAMDIIGPEVGDDVELPVIVTIHGGGLVMGDRRISRKYTRELAKAGYLTFSVEYRLAPRANVCEQLDDVCAGMDLVGRRLVDYNVDFGRVFLTAESAGAYLAIYVAAMKNSKALQEAIGYKPTHLVFRALGLIGGMFYTNKPDLIGMLFSDQFYGDKVADEKFLRFMDPEHPEIVRNLPPTFFITSRGDFLNSYTIDYHKALQRAGVETKLLYYGEKELGHASVTTNPELEQSQDAISKMLPWFEMQAEKARRYTEPAPEDAERLAAVQERIDSGEICHQKAWQLVRELNSVTDAVLDGVALHDHKRNWTYRQLFREEERYAEVFTGLGVTEVTGSRVGVIMGVSATAVITFYALNMLGVSVSLIDAMKLLTPKVFRKVVKEEGITDLVLTDTGLNAQILQDLVDHRKKLGLRNIVVMRSSKQVTYPNELEEQQAKSNWYELKQVKHVLFMPKLLRTYQATPIAYGSGSNDKVAAIVHTSGTSKGTNNPVPLSDVGLNETALRFLVDDRFASLRGRSTGMLAAPLSMNLGFVDMMHVPFALSGSVVVWHDHRDTTINDPAAYVEEIEQGNVDVITSYVDFIEKIVELSSEHDADVSHIKYLMCGGSPMSNGQVRHLRELLDERGSSAIIANGYGLAETAGACIVTVCELDVDADDAELVPIGRPMAGVRVLVQDDDGQWHDPADGPCVGELYIHSNSNSCGRLGDVTYFEPAIVDGVSYVCTNDSVMVDEQGVITVIGRANRYFLNDEGKRFNAGVVESAFVAQPGICACAIIPTFERYTLHDNVPTLYVQVSGDDDRKPKTIVKQALQNVYLGGTHVAQNALPWTCIIAKKLPTNNIGKVDIVSLMSHGCDGREYRVVEKTGKNGERKGVELVRTKNKDDSPMPVFDAAGIPNSIRKERLEMARNYLQVYGLNNIPQYLRDAVAEVMGIDTKELERMANSFGEPESNADEASAPLTKTRFGRPRAAVRRKGGFIGGPCSAFRCMLPGNKGRQRGRSIKEGEKTMKKSKKAPMPLRVMMPPNAKGMPFAPVMPFAPKPPKKGKKQGKKAPVAPFALVMSPVAIVVPKPRKKGGKKGPKAPFAPVPGFPPFFGGMR